MKQEPVAPSPFTSPACAPASWTSSPFPKSSSISTLSALTPSIPPGTPTPSTASASDAPSAEMLDAMRASYPDPSKAPPKIKALLQKYDKSAGQLWVQNVAYERERKDKALAQILEIREAQEVHRKSWLDHLHKSASQWKDMMASYQKQRVNFVTLMNQARQEFKGAQDSLTLLHQQADQEQLETDAANDADVSALELGEKEKEEEERLKENVNKLLSECVDLTSQEVPIEVDESETEDGKPKSKRARSSDALARSS